MKLFLKGARCSNTRRHNLERFILLCPRCALRHLRSEPCYCLALSRGLSIARCSDCHVASHEHCHFPWPSIRQSERRLCSATCVDITHSEGPLSSCDLRVFLGWTSICMSEMSLVKQSSQWLLTVRRKRSQQVSTFWFRGKPQSLASQRPDGGRRGATGQAASHSHKNACHPASFFLLMWDMIATIETSAKHNDQLLLPQQQYP